MSLFMCIVCDVVVVAADVDADAYVAVGIECCVV